MYRAGIENVFYCDTDSIVLYDQGLKRIKDMCGKKLGQFDDQFPKGEVILEAEFLSAKCYYLIVKGEEEVYDYVKFKGIKKPTVRDLKLIREMGSLWIY